MRPVRFVALSEDGQAFVLADEVGRLLALPIDERVATAIRHDKPGGGTGVAVAPSPVTQDAEAVLSPRDIQARIRSGESAEDVARIAGVPVDRVLRYAGPVLQERAMLAQHARRTRLRSTDKSSVLADVVDSRLAQHGVDSDKIAWDAYRRDDGTWRIVATWPSGKATAQAVWELDKTRQHVTPYDDMAQYLCAERPMPILGQDPPIERPGRGLAPPARPEGGRGELGRGAGHEPMRPPAPPAAPRPETSRPGRGLAEPTRHSEPARHTEPTRHSEPARHAEPAAARATDPIRSGRDALIASLDRPLAPETPGTPAAPGELARPTRRVSAFDEDPDAPKEVPAVPSLAVLRPRRPGGPGGPEQPGGGDKSRKRLPSWDDVLFGSAPAARESS
jgi:Protein of unknown function (DUF3071)